MSSGRIVQVIGAVIDVEFPRENVPKVYDALRVAGQDLTLEVQQQLGDGVVRAIAMGSSEGIGRGLEVENTGAPISVPVGEETLGRIMNVLGEPIDEKGPVNAAQTLPIHRAAPSYEDQSGAVEILETGIKVIDLVCPFAKGGKVGLFGGAGVGTVTMLELIRNIAVGSRSFVFAGVGSAPAKGDFYHEMRTNVLDKISLVFGQMNEPPGNRLRVALTGLTMPSSSATKGGTCSFSWITSTATRWPEPRCPLFLAACLRRSGISRRWRRRWVFSRSASRPPRPAPSHLSRRFMSPRMTSRTRRLRRPLLTLTRR